MNPRVAALVSTLFCLVLPAWLAQGTTRVVPTQIPTIQQAIFTSATGDTVLVLPGTYQENILIDRAIVVRSEQGPGVTAIDGGAPSNPDLASTVRIMADPGPPFLTGGSIEGFAIRNGTGSRMPLIFGGRGGGGILVMNTGAPGPLIRNNWIHSNRLAAGTNVFGSGIFAKAEIDNPPVAARIIDNRIYDNSVEVTGGDGGSVISGGSLIEGNEIFDNHSNRSGVALAMGEGSAIGNVIACNSGAYVTGIASSGTLEGNTVVGNWSFNGGPAVWVTDYSDGLCTLRANNIAFNLGTGIECFQPLPPEPLVTFDLECNNISGNTGGQISGACSDAIGRNGNISEDPLFGQGGCPSQPGDWCLSEDSPLLPENSPPGCGLIGAPGQCPPIGVSETPASGQAFAIMPAQPNPFGARTTLGFHLRENAAVDVVIYSVMGRLVRRIEAGVLAAGDHEIEWEGETDSGGRAPSGAYVARIRVGENEVARSLILFR